MRSLLLAFVLAACASTAPHRQCHKSDHADGVGPDGELHYPEVCTAQTTPAPRHAAPAPVAERDPVLARLRPETPDPCREYTREQCAAGADCEQVIREVNKIATTKRAYSQCVSMMKREARR
jgi:hypothetical protein